MNSRKENKNRRYKTDLLLASGKLTDSSGDLAYFKGNSYYYSDAVLLKHCPRRTSELVECVMANSQRLEQSAVLVERSRCLALKASAGATETEILRGFEEVGGK